VSLWGRGREVVGRGGEGTIINMNSSCGRSNGLINSWARWGNFYSGIARQ
jgi:hypothetical protein